MVGRWTTLTGLGLALVAFSPQHILGWFRWVEAAGAALVLASGVARLTRVDRVRPLDRTPGPAPRSLRWANSVAAVAVSIGALGWLRDGHQSSWLALIVIPGLLMSAAWGHFDRGHTAEPRAT